MRTAVRRHARTLPWQGRAALVALAMVGLVVLGASMTSGDDLPPAALAQTPPVSEDAGYWPTAPAPLTPRPSPPTAPSTSPDGGRTAPARPPVSVPARVTPVPPTTTPSAPALSPGTRVGLEPVTAPGFRVRHRDFVGRIDRIGAGSPSLDRADSTFAVRAGLADARCVSLEAVNYPGFYLRHQDFAIHLHRRDSSAIFAADATFCAGAGLAGRDMSLRSYNYPDRYLYHERSRLYIARASGAARSAMTFAVKGAL
ncbi:AbfB domain-containing protein [Phytohabitans sp. LJ34]|uniref:AbfB domain-containing protein n=1 Tax=Phytohabitans sp. LJ34 TaxID=3452217 RepID=UPI003F8ABF08